MRIDVTRTGPLAVATLLAGLCTSCEKKPQSAVGWHGEFISKTAAAAPAPAQAKAFFQGAAQQAPGLHLAYTHAIDLEVGGGALAAHFNAARDRCLNTPALHCLLLQSEISTPTPASDGAGLLGDERPSQQGSASLRVRLPHDQVVAFANSLTDTLPGEKPGLVRVLRQSTTAQDLNHPITDVNQRVSQLQDYLASLKALGSRLTISVSDLVKIASETAQAQTQIEAAQAEQRDLTLRVDTEELDIDFQAAQPPAVAPGNPIDQVLADSQDILHENEADALRFAIAALPWVPVGFAALIVLWIARRLIFGARRRPIVAAAVAPPRQAPVLSGYRPLDE